MTTRTQEDKELEAVREVERLMQKYGPLFKDDDTVGLTKRHVQHLLNRATRAHD